MDLESLVSGISRRSLEARLWKSDSAAQGTLHVLMADSRQMLGEGGPEDKIPHLIVNTVSVP